MTSSLPASWLPWVCLAMVLLIWLSCVMQPQYLRGLVSNGFAMFSVNAFDQVPSIGSQTSQWLFNSIVPAIGVFLMVEQEVVQGTSLFVWLIGLSLLIDALRLMTSMLVRYTFRLSRQMSMAYLCYYALRSLFTFVLFALMLLVTYTSPHIVWFVVLAIASVIYLITLGWQWGRLFCTSPLGIAGLVLYMLTIELLPTALLWEAGRQLYFLHIA